MTALATYWWVAQGRVVLGVPGPLLGLTQHRQEIEPVHLAIVEVVLQVERYRAIGFDHVGGLRPEEVYDRGVLIDVCSGDDPAPHEQPLQETPVLN